jgi:hypothetical protein
MWCHTHIQVVKECGEALQSRDVLLSLYVDDTSLFGILQLAEHVQKEKPPMQLQVEVYKPDPWMLW